MRKGLLDDRQERRAGYGHLHVLLGWNDHAAEQLVMTNIGARLGPTRDAVLGLHRALLAAERIAWVRMNGRIVGNAEFLQLAIHDPWFLWLRPMTALIAALDEAMLDQAPENEVKLPVLLATARELLHPNELGDDFQQRYFEMVQRSPDVAVAHGVFMKELLAALR